MTAPISVGASGLSPVAPLTLPLVAAQGGIWMAEQIAPEANAYTVAHYTVLTGALDEAALTAAIRHGLAQADILHARFTLDGETGLPVQHIPATLSPEDVPAPDCLDLRGEADPQGVATAAMAADVDAAPTADAGAPLYRHMILRVGDDRWFWYQRYHHLVIDGFGFAAISRRIAALYDLIRAGAAPTPSPFVDFVQVAEEYAAYDQSEACARDGTYWREQERADGAPPTLALSTIDAPEHVANAHVHRALIRVEGDSAARLATLGRERRMGAAEMAMAAILTYLHRMTGAEQLAAGLPLMRRMGSVAIDSIAPTVNVLPLRVKIEPRLCLLEVAQRLAQQLRAARRHQRYDAERLQRELGLVGSSGALYGPTINLKVYDPAVRMQGLSTQTHVLAAGPVEDMEFGIWPDGEALAIEITANPARYGAQDVADHGARLAALLDRLAAAPERPVGELDLLTVDERAAIDGWSHGPLVTAEAGWTSVLDVLRHSAAARPAQTALSDRDGAMDFATLERKIATLARMLIARGIGPGDSVATALPRRNDAIVAMLAVMSTGAAWMPLDPDYPAERLAMMCADARPALLLAHSHLVEGLETGAQTLCLDDPAVRAEWVAQAGDPVTDADRERPLTPDDIAYIIYTSGSTGRPKGVMVPHRGLLNLLIAHRAAVHLPFAAMLDRPVRAGHAMSLAFDSSWEQILWLLIGHELHLCDEEQRRDAQALTDFCRERAIDTIDLSPAMAQQMVDCGLLDGDHVPGMILVGGEAVPPALWTRLRETPGLTPINFYGPTEYSVDALGADLRVATGPVIGRPIANTRIHILDHGLNAVPVGVAGELYIAGPGLAAGYLGRAELTAARFVANPFGDGERLYRTGDLVRWRADGQVEFLGRTDHQVKIRGFRIEIGEVEQAIAALPGVRDALVLARPHGGTNRLLAWCRGEGDAAAWLASLAQTLPDYMVPSALVQVDAWPLNVNGKIDRNALPDPVTATDERPIIFASEEERLLCAAMAQVIGIEAVRPDADFFALGGDSIGAMALGTAMRRQGWALRPRDIFAHRRADRMAAAMTPLKPMAQESAEEPAGVLPPLPMVRWFAEHHGMEARFAHGVLFRVPADMTGAHMAQGLVALARAHPLLTARSEGADLALVGGDPVIALESGMLPADFDRAFVEAAARLSPAAGRMMQARLWLDPAGGAHMAMIVLHHLVTDGVSWRVLLPELESACRAAMAGTAPLIPREECSARRWAQLLDSQRSARRTELPLWREILGAKVTPIAGPIDPALHTQETAQERRLLLDAGTSAALLDRLPGAYDASVEELLLAALHHGLGRVFGTGAMRVAMESHGRDMLDEETDPSRTVGWLTAEYPVLLEAAETPLDAVRAARQALRRIPDHGVGFGVLRYLEGAVTDTIGEGEKTEILFNFLGKFPRGNQCFVPVTNGGRFADAFAVEVDPAMVLQHVLEVNCFVADEGLAINWSWARGLLTTAQIKAIHAEIGVFLDILATQDRADTLVPADCPGLSQETLDALRERHGPLAQVLPLLPLQQGLLFHAQLGAAASRYNSVTRMTLDGALDYARLWGVFDALLTRNAQVSARFDSQTASEPLQIIPLARPQWPVETHDLSALSPTEQAARIDAIEQAELARDFTVEGGLLVHAQLIRLSATRHCLMLNAHHLIVDGWSTPIIVRDLMRAYAGGMEALPAPSVSYANVVRALNARDTAPARAAWADAMAGARPTVLFPDTPTTPDVRETELVLSPELEDALRQRCRDKGLTLNSVMQGMWGAMLSILTGRDDVIFGTPVSGRTSPVDGVGEHIGLFSNTVPVRVRIDPRRPLIDQIAQLQAAQGAMMEHDGLTLAEIQRIAGGETLFDTLLVSENYPDGEDAEAHGGVRIAAINNRGYTHYPMTVMVLPGDRLRLLIEHRDSVGDAQALAERMRRVIEHIAHDGDEIWARFDPRLPQEIALIAATNATGVAIPDATLRDHLVSQAARTPDALALVDADHRLSYAQMRAQVGDLARRLVEAGAGRGDVIAVALPRSVRLTIALHAVIEVGAAYLPLDAGYPAERLAMMVEDARPRLTITDARCAERLPDGARMLFEALAEAPCAPTAVEAIGGADAAYLIYTSGSTGRPKGALLSHRAIVNRLLWMQHAYPIGADDRVLQKTPCSFDVSVWEFFWPLMEGSVLVMAPPEAHRDPEALAALIAREAVTTLHFVPSMLAAMVVWMEEDAAARAPLCASLKQVFASGEALSAAVAARQAALMPHAPLHNLYGPTEAAVDVTYRAASDGPVGASIPIGRPVWNTQLRILDGALRPVPVGVAGELYLTGVQLADYYLDRATMTATRFVADPMGDGTRMYRTGDIARWTADGEVEYLGRSDDQLKIRGQRIELGEIEAALLALPDVAGAAAQACVLGAGTGGSAGDGADARQIVGYVVAAEGADVDGAAVRAALSERLPAHMVPVAVMVIDALPLSLNGKLDRKALPLPSVEGSAGRAPRPGMESQIAGAFARLLEVEAVQAEDDFFALGGHSLLAMRLAAELRQVLARPVSVGQIMGASSVARLSALLSDEVAARDPANAGFGPVLHLRGGRGRPLFCFHPASGFAWQYSGLSRHLPRHIPIIGLQSPRDGGVIAASADLNAACEAHLARIRAIQPHGPYHLVGYSLGGTLAQGVAARLQAAGEAVGFLALFDTYPPEGQDWSGSTNSEAQAEADREREQFLTATQGERDAQEEAEKDAMFAGIVANYGDAVRLLSAGRTPRFDGRATLFVATRTLPEGWDVEGCWAPYLSGVDVVRVDCAHEDILAPDTLAVTGPVLAQMLGAVPSLASG